MRFPGLELLRRWVCCLITITFAATGLTADVVAEWNETILVGIKEETRPPGQTARNLAKLHVAMFDAANHCAPQFTSYADHAVKPDGAQPIASAIAAAERVCTVLFPNRRATFEALSARQRDELAASPAALQRSRQVGQSIADVILATREGDGAATLRTYLPRAEPGQWRRTAPAYRPPETSHWGLVTPWVLADVDAFLPDGPPELDSERYAEALNEIHALGGKGSTERTEEQGIIAHFWSDFSYTVTPPGHWNVIAGQATEGRDMPFLEKARLFALLNVTLADAGIVAFRIKYVENFWRPETAIWRADEDGNPATEPDTDWRSFLESPPHPEYVSAHSTFSGSAARLLALALGSDEFTFTATSDGLPGATRTFERFSDAAAEIGMSRLYGGIHYRFSNEDGLATGRKIADHVFATAFKPLPE